MTSAYDLIAAQIDPYVVGNRTRSAALLAWFLETVWRMDPELVADAICDGSGDKGIDGITIDDDLAEIAVFQSKHRDNPENTQGDADLRSFIGVAPYFADAEGIDQLLNSGPNLELRNLIKRLELRELLSARNYRVRLVFVTNAEMDPSAVKYLVTLEGREPVLELWDRTPLAAIAARTQHPGLLDSTIELMASSNVLLEPLDRDTDMAIALIPAAELVKQLPGIADLTVFDLNVRLNLGNTRINRELGKTVQDPTEHHLFAAYHNGLTLLTKTLTIDGPRLILEGVSVVNGCQSLLALFSNQQQITPELRVLVKIVQVGENQGLESVITYRSNNQNPVNIRDQRSTHMVQLDLQKQVADAYAGKVFYAIREGESSGATPVLDNRLAAQLLTAIWLKEPWAAVRKVKLFDVDYHRVFGRYVDAHKLRLAYFVNQLVEERRGTLAPEFEASFAAVRFTIAYLVAQVARQTPLGDQLFEDPSRWLPEREQEVLEALAPLVDQVIDSVNVYIDGRKDQATDEAPFDPKVVFKSAAGVRELEHQVIQAFKLLSRQFERFDQEPGFNVPPVR